LAITGNGFFQVTMPDGNIGYTRDGAFSKNQDGIIVNASGYPLEPQIAIPQDATSITVAKDGTVSVTQPGQALPQEIGQIALVNFINPAGLNHIGGNLVLQTQASGDPIEGQAGMDGLGEIMQGFLEMSNVDVADEMVNMIIGQRAYEANSKTIRTVDDMLAIITNLKR
jgi:flagellar basal-body rod protein FlgG